MENVKPQTEELNIDILDDYEIKWTNNGTLQATDMESFMLTYENLKRNMINNRQKKDKISSVILAAVMF